MLSKALRQVEEARLGALATKQDLLGLKQGLTNLDTKVDALETRMEARLDVFGNKRVIPDVNP